jgi:hypothetical protein
MQVHGDERWIRDRYGDIPEQGEWIDIDGVQTLVTRIERHRHDDTVTVHGVSHQQDHRHL